MCKETDRYVYVVFAEAIYRHGCFGIFEAEGDAITAAVNIAAIDNDDHHRYCVYKYEFNRELSNTGKILLSFEKYYSKEDGESIFEIKRTEAIEEIAKRDKKKDSTRNQTK